MALSDKSAHIKKMRPRRKQMINAKLSNGFTLIELLVSMGILVIIFGISTITLSTIIPATSLGTTYDNLISDIRAQQTFAMSNNASYGIHFDSTSYTIFQGTYVPGASANYVVTFDPTITLTGINFPGSQIVFTPGLGDVTGYVSGSDSVTITSAQTGSSNLVKINKYGATY